MSGEATLANFLEKAKMAELAIRSRLLEMSRQAEFVEFGVGRLSARDAFRIFGARSLSLKRAGIATVDLDAALLNLQLTLPGDEILLHHFESEVDHVTIFSNSKLEVILGFLVVPRKFPPVSSVPSPLSGSEFGQKEGE